jgi:hypothetical protein
MRYLVPVFLVAIATSATAGGPSVIIRDFVPVQGMCRAQRPITIGALFENTGEVAVTVEPRLTVPDGVRITRAWTKPIKLDGKQTDRASWVVQAGKPGDYHFEVRAGDVTSVLDVHFYDPVPIKKLPYIPDPEPVKTDIIVGAHNCPLWEANRPQMWRQIRKHPERTPALGFYSQENPEVADWETKWAVEHGVNFFLYCWYRTSQGGPVTMNYCSAIDALMKSRFRDKMKFTIMWENQNRGRAGVADEHDLMSNLLPFWIKNYFKDSCYLKIDNKPLLFIYRPEFLVQDLGSVENVRKAFDRMRQACREAGFDGLYILGEYRGHEPNGLNYLKQLGLDYVFAYCWYIPDNPTPEQAIKAQMEYIRQTSDINALPQIVTVSQAWSGWSDEGTIWKIPPPQFEDLLRQAKEYISTFPASDLGSKILLLDNWNEWGEGHYLAPYREYGFGYLDAVRNVFSNAPRNHVDLIPEDIGMGPYDRAYTTWNAEQERLHNLGVRKIRKRGADEPGLVAWWAFDEPRNSPAVFDYSGHQFGGVVRSASRASGFDGSALKCDGGCIQVTGCPTPAGAMTIECWVRTDAADQSNKFIISTHGAAAGYGLGMADGKPMLIIPRGDWKPSVVASDKLSLGRWVHLAGTYDGQTMRIYVDGVQSGSADRGGDVAPSGRDLFLGSFSIDHDAHFTGILDEVRLYDRALTPSEIAAHAVKSLK